MAVVVVSDDHVCFFRFARSAGTPSQSLLCALSNWDDDARFCISV